VGIKGLEPGIIAGTERIDQFSGFNYKCVSILYDTPSRTTQSRYSPFLQEGNIL
jgi:hypothetical protein